MKGQRGAGEEAEVRVNGRVKHVVTTYSFRCSPQGPHALLAALSVRVTSPSADVVSVVSVVDPAKARVPQHSALFSLPPAAMALMGLERRRRRGGPQRGEAGAERGAGGAAPLRSEGDRSSHVARLC